MHANSDHSSYLLFPSCKVTKTVSYAVLQKQFTSAVADSIQVGLSKVGFHCMRRGGARTLCVLRAGAPHEVVQKAMVGYYATLKGEDLAKVSKFAF